MTYVEKEAGHREGDGTQRRSRTQRRSQDTEKEAGFRKGGRTQKKRQDSRKYCTENSNLYSTDTEGKLQR